MEILDAFKVICDSVDNVLSTQGFVRHKVDSTSENEVVALFTSENMAYSVIYYKDKMHMVMRSCTMTDEGPDNDWKAMATWMFDPENDTVKEAQSIGNDFAEAVTAPTAIKRQKQTKKKKKDDEGNADPIFFAKRMVKLFPELKDEIKVEEDCYFPFRGVTFTREHIVPRVIKLVENGNKKEIEKLVSILSTQYKNGDMDTRSIITMVVLNSIDPKYDEILKEYMEEDLLKIFKASSKMRGKEFKPEKIKKPKKTIAQRL